MAPYQDRYLINVSAAYDGAVSLRAHIQPTRVSGVKPSPLLQPQSELSQSLAWTSVDASEWAFLPLFHTDLSKHKSNHDPSLNKTLQWVPIMKKAPIQVPYPSQQNSCSPNSLNISYCSISRGLHVPVPRGFVSSCHSQSQACLTTFTPALFSGFNLLYPLFGLNSKVTSVRLFLVLSNYLAKVVIAVTLYYIISFYFLPSTTSTMLSIR